MFFIEDNDTDENFLPMKTPKNNLMTDSTNSATSSSMESSIASSMMSSVSDATTLRNRRRGITFKQTAKVQLIFFF